MLKNAYDHHRFSIWRTIEKIIKNGVQLQQFKISMGILIAKALNKAKPDAKAMVSTKLKIKKT